MKNEKEKLDYDYRMTCFDDAVNARHSMDKSILITNISIIFGLLYYHIDYYYIPLIFALISFISNIISDRLFTHYSMELSECIYIDDEFNNIRKCWDKNIPIVNKIYEGSFYLGLISMLIVYLVNL